MNIRELTIEEMDAIYHAHLVFDFPASEVKPMSHILKGYEEGKYFAYGMFEEAQLLAYGFFIRSTQYQTNLLDYLAVVRGKRDGGYGSIFLKELQAICAREGNRLILEVENPAYTEDEAQKAYQEKRIRFYQRNAMLASDVTCYFYGNEYLILYGKDKENKCPSTAEIDKIYRDFFGDQLVDKYVTFH